MSTFSFMTGMWSDCHVITLQWRHNGRDSVSNHQPHDCLLNLLFRRRSKKISKLRVTGPCVGNSPVTGEFPTQRPVTRKMLPFDDVIMYGMANIDTPRPEQNGRHFEMQFSWIKIAVFWFELLTSLFLKIELTNSQHWVTQLFHFEQVTSHRLINHGVDLWRHMAPLGHNEFV